MKTANEIKTAIRQWWAYNQTLAQGPEERYFAQQIQDWESGFRNHTKENYQAPSSSFWLLSAKDVKDGLSIHITGSDEVNGILDLKTGLWTDKSGVRDTETVTFIGARIGNQ